MKQFIKFTIALIMGIVTLGFQSCGSDDDEPTKPTDYHKVESIIGEWSFQAELENGKEVSCDQFTMDFNTSGKLVSQYSSRFTRYGSSSIFDSTVVCTFKDA